MYFIIASVVKSSKSLFGVVIINVSQSLGTSFLFKMFNFSYVNTSSSKYFAREAKLVSKLNSVYPSKKYTFGILSDITLSIADVIFCSVTSTAT